MRGPGLLGFVGTHYRMSPVSVPIVKKRIGLRRQWTERAADEGFMWRDSSFADKQVLLQKLLLSGARCGGFIDQLYCCADITQSLEGFCGVTGVAFFLTQNSTILAFTVNFLHETWALPGGIPIVTFPTLSKTVHCNGCDSRTRATVTG